MIADRHVLYLLSKILSIVASLSPTVLPWSTSISLTASSASFCLTKNEQKSLVKIPSLRVALSNVGSWWYLIL